ncbi:MAG: hypothetical protein ACJAZ2_002318 [Glaciecola sp.]|jgi:hypothetical protein
MVKKLIGILPTLGIILFSALYFYSSTFYPGGCQADLNSSGFDWINNYWCNLMNVQGMNGLENPARPFAIMAMLVLCLSLMLFFVQFAQKLITTALWRYVVQFSGIISMLFAIFIFTEYHDLMTVLSSLFGAIVVIGMIFAMYRSDMTFYKVVGIMCLLLLAVNNYIYYSKQLIEHLPLIQKITFAVVLLWIIGLNNKIIRLDERIQ